MEISRIVNDIIKKRNSKLPTIEQKRKSLCALLKALDQFDDLKSQIVDENGNPREGKYQLLAQQNPDMILKLNAMSTAICRQKVDKALEECDKVEKRFKRESINISVVGKARIGKSQFLKGISNLDDKVIPAFAETDCTGAVSIIENHPGIGLEAHFTFKTEDQMIEAVQSYLDKIVPPEKGRIVLYAMSQIGDRSLLDQVEAKLVPGRVENNLRTYLRKYVEHYAEWAPLVKKKSLIITDQDEIQTYVAQNDGNPDVNKRRFFYKYLAVDTCRIYCTFDYQEAGKITLIDTVGLGDNSLGIEDDLVEVVNDKSDAVVFLHLPYSPTGGYVDSEVAKAYSLIESNCRGRDLNKWLFWLINEAPGHPKTPNDRARCEASVQTLENNGWHGAMTKIVNIIDKNQVREEFLIPMLNMLMHNLDDIDALYTTDLIAALDAVRKEYNSFCTNAKKVMSSNLKNAANLLPQMTMDIDEVEKARKGKLRALAMSEKQLRNVPCTELNDCVQTIVADVKTGVAIPNKAEILAQVRESADAANIYNEYCNQLRNQVSQRFTDVDSTMTTLVEHVKNQITEILVSENGCRLGSILAVSSDKKPYEWLNDFAEMVLDPQQYPTLHAAFKTVYDFDFSVRGFLTYEVRACLDKIDPQITSTFISVNEDDDNQTATNIWFTLKRNMKSVADELTVSMSDLFSKPHRAFFAIIKEFSDKVNFSEGVKREWAQLYSDNYSVVWASKYKSMVAADIASGEWNEMLSELLQCNNNCVTLHII